MAVNFQNFVTPLTNKTHLFTIIIAAVLFGAFRITTGGEIAVSNNNANNHIERPLQKSIQQPPANTVVQKRQAPPAAVNTRQEPAAPRQQQGSVSRPFSADTMPATQSYTTNRRREHVDIDNVIDTPAEVRKPPKKKSDALDDIERSLGISF